MPVDRAECADGEHHRVGPQNVVGIRLIVDDDVLDIAKGEEGNIVGVVENEQHLAANVHRRQQVGRPFRLGGVPIEAFHDADLADGRTGR